MKQNVCGGLCNYVCVYCMLQGEIEGVNAEPNDRKVSKASPPVNKLNQMSPQHFYTHQLSQRKRGEIKKNNLQHYCTLYKPAQSQPWATSETRAVEWCPLIGAFQPIRCYLLSRDFDDSQIVSLSVEITVV